MAMQRAQVGAILAVVITTIVVGALAASLLMASQTIPSTGNVKTVGVGVYWNAECTSNVTSIDWGLLEPGDAVETTVYVKNEGTRPAILNMTTDNWNPPSAADSIVLTWNRDSHVLSAGQVVSATLTLTVSADISGISIFSLDIIVSGTEQA